MNKGELNIKNNFAIRFTKREDTKLIFNFIKELAEYEKLLNEVVADGKPGIYLEDLYVRSEYRGKGFGKKLLSYLANLCIERDCRRLEWRVLDWNKSSIDAVDMDEWTTYRMTEDVIKNLAKEL